MNKFSLPTLLLISLVLTCAFIEIADAISAAPTSPPIQAPPGVPQFCVGKCIYRCSKNPRDLCKKLCMGCCAKCKCAPTGPYGSEDVCPCYRDMKSKKGQPKCP